MKKLLIGLSAIMFTGLASANSAVLEGVIDKSSPISSEIGKDGRPILGAAAGVGLGSLIGDGSGRDAAMVVGGIAGARRQASKRKEVMHGWQYVIKGKDDQMYSINSWCDKPEQQCPGIAVGKEVYIINGDQVSVK